MRLNRVSNILFTRGFRVRRGTEAREAQKEPVFSRQPAGSSGLSLCIRPSRAGVAAQSCECCGAKSVAAALIKSSPLLPLVHFHTADNFIPKGGASIFFNLRIGREAPLGGPAIRQQVEERCYTGERRSLQFRRLKMRK